jgi:hypothetical protein
MQGGPEGSPQNQCQSSPHASELLAIMDMLLQKPQQPAPDVLDQVECVAKSSLNRLVHDLMHAQRLVTTDVIIECLTTRT